MIFRSIYKKPVLLVGNGARAAGAAELILEFAEKTDIPVLTTMNAVDLAQGDQHFGFIGTYGNRIANMMLNECDLLISVGARLGLRQVGNVLSRFAPKAKLIRADIDQYELSRDIKENEEKYLTDARTFIESLLQEPFPRYTEWRENCRAAQAVLEKYDKEIGNLAIEKIASMMPEDPVVAVDVGQHECWCAQSLKLKGNKGRVLIGGGYGSMGCGLPFAIGASIACGHAPVYCITGDGGLQMNIQELETVCRERLPIKILVLNNHVLGKISEIQRLSYGEKYAQTTRDSGYTVPDLKQVSNAYGIRACTLSSYQELDDYAAWFQDSEPCLIDIQLPADTLLIPKIQWETGTMRPKLPENVESEVCEMLKGGRSMDNEIHMNHRGGVLQ